MDEECINKKSRYSHSSEDEKYGYSEDTKVKSEHSSNESDKDDYESEDEEEEGDEDVNNAKTQSEDSEVHDESEDEPEVKPIIKREDTYKDKTSRKLSSEELKKVEYKKSSSSSSSKNEHDTLRNSKNYTSSEKPSSSEKYSSVKHKSSSEKSKTEKHKIKNEIQVSSEKSKSVSTEKCNSSSDKYKSSSDKYKSHKSSKHSSKFDNQSEYIHKSEKEKHVNTDHKDKQLKDQSRSKESSSKNKNKHSSDKDKEKLDKEKERSKDKTREKTSHSHGNKDEKRHSSSDNKSKSSDNKSKFNKAGDSSKQKSSSSSSRQSSSSSKVSHEQESPKKRKIQNVNENSEDGIDCGSGASFAEALGMISPVKTKKKTLSKEPTEHTTNFEQMSPAALLAPTAKLMPLPPLEISALPEISPNYKPRPPPKLLPYFSEEETMGTAISSKNQRTKVYSGNKIFGILPTLYELCVQVLQDNIDALEYTGGVPYDILKPVVDKATPNQLFTLEHHNPYLMEDTDHIWQKFCAKHFRKEKRQEMETWREMFMRCKEEQESKLKSLTANIKMAQDAKNAPVKQTKIAYVDSVVKPPRNIARKQAIHGTARVAAASPAARVAALASATNVVRAGTVRPPPTASIPSSSIVKPKKAPLMQKALQFMRGRKR
ncbi:Transcription elongation factor B polypeptide 3 [Eumeta japonica]|uniref:Transcription elongation factor B polypeptide 3 n=1 Tax=Eumeta variegata TaxID=151549 RepID=A0A4C1WEP8_EUMVA|nr:Transcription elongation factor B polypeptide 3 [Eumeta japonica]